MPVQKTRKEKTTAAPTEDSKKQRAIQETAYYKWLSCGKEGGSAQDDWVQAELELENNLYSEDDDVSRDLNLVLPKYTGKR